MTASNSAGNSSATHARPATVNRHRRHSAGEHRGADDQRHAQQGQTADRERRQLERHHADQLQLRVAALRHGGDNCSYIGGATSQTYTLVSGRRRHHHPVAVTASNSAGNSSTTSAQTATVQATSPPVGAVWDAGDGAGGMRM